MTTAMIQVPLHWKIMVELRVDETRVILCVFNVFDSPW